MSDRRALLTTALGFLQLRQEPPEVAMLRRWLDSWRGLETAVERAAEGEEPAEGAEATKGKTGITGSTTACCGALGAEVLLLFLVRPLLRRRV